MKIFIFHSVDELTKNYHSGGGLVVIAESIKDVLEVVKDDKDIKISKEELSKVIIYELKGHYVKKYYIFQDAGCCG